jgi:Multiubiquitin/Prokaryotic E2 family E
MTTAKTDSAGEGKAKTKITIQINGAPHHVEQSEMSGAELKALGDIPPQNRLFREVPGPGDDVAIGDDETVELKSGYKFYDLPVGVHGAPTLVERLEPEVEKIRAEFDACDVRPQENGSVVLVIGPVALDSGWSRAESRIFLVVPPGYPEQRPEGFHADGGLTLADGATSKCSGQNAVGGESTTFFCWNPELWDPSKDDLWKYAKLMAERFDEAA